MLRSYRALLNFYRGETDKAMAEVRDILAGHPDLHSQKIALAYCYVAKGETDGGLGQLDEKVLTAANADQDSSYRLATAYAMAGKSDQAIKWLERAVAIGNENYRWISTNPLWASMTEDARFKAILERLKEKWDRLNQAH
jgi:tetratricopeptide (TPR) repeat protein